MQNRKYQFKTYNLKNREQDVCQQKIQRNVFNFKYPVLYNKTHTMNTILLVNLEMKYLIQFLKEKPKNNLKSSVVLMKKL